MQSGHSSSTTAIASRRVAHVPFRCDNLHLFGYIVEPMAKSSFYFEIAILVVVDIV